MNKIIAKALKALSTPSFDLKKHYKVQRNIQNLKKFHPLRFFYKIKDYKIMVGDYPVPIRIFYPEQETDKLIIFMHGGGWIAGSVDTYETMCSLLARELKTMVVSIEYRLAPEYKFPVGLEDCYGVVKAIITENFFDVLPENITLMGDSAGGNMAAVISLMGRDRQEFHICKQILFYPLTFYDHSDTSPFLSVHENGYNFVLTNQRLNDYLELYIEKKEDIYNPYFAPLLMADLTQQPKTLIITAELDPLRDEGEAYGKRLLEQGNDVTIYRMPNVIHGFFGNIFASQPIKKSYELMEKFLNEK